MKRLLPIIVFTTILAACGVSTNKDGKPTAQTETVELNAENSSIEVVEHNAKATDNMWHTYVTVKNNSKRLCTATTLKVIYTNKDNKVVGSGNGTGLNIPSGMTKVVECLAMDVNDATNYEVQVETSLFE